MNDIRIEVVRGYLKLHSWHERRGDTLVYMSRADKYGRDHELISVGEPVEGGVLHLNGWEPPASPASMLVTRLPSRLLFEAAMGWYARWWRPSGNPFRS